MKQRDIAVDIVKFFAVFLIINSHADICYPKYGILATGGAIGDSLFMFVSGFTLFLGTWVRFDNYYKRRINRIYPSAFAATLAIWFIGGEYIRVPLFRLCKTILGRDNDFIYPPIYGEGICV